MSTPESRRRAAQFAKRHEQRKGAEPSKPRDRSSGRFAGEGAGRRALNAEWRSKIGRVEPSSAGGAPAEPVRRSSPLSGGAGEGVVHEAAEDFAAVLRRAMKRGSR